MTKSRKAPQLLSLPDRSRLADDYGAGVPMKTLTDKYGITAGYIYVLMQNAGVRRPTSMSHGVKKPLLRDRPFTGQQGKALSQETRTAILKDYEAGELTNDDIAAKYNVGRSYPSHLARSMGRTMKETAAWRRELPHKHSKPRKQQEPDLPPKPVVTVSRVEVRRLFQMGVGRTKIAAMLRCPYKAIEEALT